MHVWIRIKCTTHKYYGFNYNDIVKKKIPGSSLFLFFFHWACRLRKQHTRFWNRAIHTIFLCVCLRLPPLFQRWLCLSLYEKDWKTFKLAWQSLHLRLCVRTSIVTGVCRCACLSAYLRGQLYWIKMEDAGNGGSTLLYHCWRSSCLDSAIHHLVIVKRRTWREDR